MIYLPTFDKELKIKRRVTMSENEKNIEEEVTKGDIDNKVDDSDLEVIIDPTKNEKKEIKHYGSKLVDTGGCLGIS